ncbi:MAG: NAD-dependent epimerase/dehydratase family protein [Thaumarchaeota archaeon]|nr:NAD-dependent epimerase/dehydratase family protein [Nitrososphaerota archaeon]
MKFVVTGGAGFIGSQLVKYLLNENYEITIIDNLCTGRLENLSGFEDKIDFHNLDILELNELRKIVKDSDGIFHLAALTSVQESYLQKEKYDLVNVDGTENIFKLAKEFKIKVIYASSSSVYGHPRSIPIKEDFLRNPINPYGTTKLNDEILAEHYSNSGVEIIGLRFFNVYGIGQTGDYAGVITKFNESIQAGKPPTIFGDGSHVRDFVSVEDVAKANLLAMQSDFNNGFVNIGTGITTSIAGLANLMIKLSNKTLKPIFTDLPEGDVKASQADVNLAKKLIGWEYETSLEVGLQKFFFN